jgi:hypothetical protein
MMKARISVITLGVDDLARSLWLDSEACCQRGPEPTLNHP